MLATAGAAPPVTTSPFCGGGLAIVAPPPKPRLSSRPKACRPLSSPRVLLLRARNAAGDCERLFDGETADATASTWLVKLGERCIAVCAVGVWSPSPSAASPAETSAAASAAAAADKVARGLAATHPHVHVFLHLWRRATLSHLATLQRGQSLETPSAVAPGHLVLQREWPPFVNDYL